MTAARATAHKDLVVGLGATGLSIARYLRRSDIDAMFFDSRKKPPGMEELNEVWPDAKVLLGDVKLPAGVGRIIASPGISDHHPLLANARKKKLEVVSDIELFAREAKAPFVAITGSNGKSTVTTLIHLMCRADGRDSLAGGNLGEPALDLLDHPTPQLYVLELSSFQLHRTKTLPAAVAVLLNVSPDHLDWHSDEAEYRKSKYRVYREATAAVVNRSDAEAKKHTRHCKHVISFGLDAPTKNQFGLRTEDGVTYLARGEALLISIDDLALYGVHNQLNALAALAAGELIGLGMPAMLQVLAEFPGLPHRMQFVARVGAVDYINDSKATNVAAAVASINSVDGMLVLIAGGDGKGGDFRELAQALEGKLRGAVLIGTDAEKIAGALDTVMPVLFAEDMSAAVQLAASCAVSDDTVLLAPACASLDQYKNYMARGEAFCAAVGALQR
ncbi:MAG: UDP-N-acetylmuramoyl-L-alanine--D-glutamate ligase [Gammaproteobacteria bacterium]|nr:UDP-N-acetylmuramoyl-L-alanine--D-glutamate ligase [Gammaproteobacteria bacterium]MBT8111422.1 UDP-N-acetylmuramoyl-L-alanine--D-glutamate ligase [Gammaproteobacteria bacterium]NNL46120.1 UDP-N-acetylmuramoyl-L-alanine--D-glutamate ligase [Woeseiaceae bacterium]